MKKGLRLSILVIFLGLLAGCSTRGIYTVKVVNGGNLVVSRGEDLSAEVVILAGGLKLEPAASLSGSVYQLSGKTDVQGTLDGNLFLWGGDLSLGPEAVIRGNLSLGNASYHESPGAAVEGEILQAELDLTLLDRLSRNFLDRLGWSGVQMALLVGLSALLGNFRPVQILNVKQTIGTHPGACLAVGGLVGLVGITLMVQMAFTILLLPMTMLGGLVLGAAILLGWVGLGGLLGEWIASKFNRDWNPPASFSVGAAAFLVLSLILQLMPVAGELLLLAASLMGLGAVFLTRFGMRLFVPAPLDP